MDKIRCLVIKFRKTILLFACDKVPVLFCFERNSVSVTFC